LGDAGLKNSWPRLAYLQFWRTVWRRRAPTTLAQLEAAVAPESVGQGNNTRRVTQELLDLLTAGYREASGGEINPGF
jgi:hypothetical protein